MDDRKSVLEPVWQAFLGFVDKVFGETHKGTLAEALAKLGGDVQHSAINEIKVHLDSLISDLQGLRKEISSTDTMSKQTVPDEVDRIASVVPEGCHSISGDDSSQTENKTPASSDCESTDISSFERTCTDPQSKFGETVAHIESQAAVRGDESRIADPNLVQIRASKAEVERRIAAFINHKQSEVNEMNVREFCYGLPDSESSCARVDAVFVGRAGTSSHLKVTRVFNTQGPQTHISAHSDTQNLRRANVKLEESVEERLHNVEQHLSVNKDSKMDMFGRLRALEERVLFLEGVSPEYFQSGPPPPKRKKPAPPPAQTSFAAPVQVKKEYQSLSEINQRIQELQSALQQKQEQTKQEFLH